jgi:3-hydroxymyristoyl/3-hydroxydecanoyl-(acyl carrier protein) dehydratase
MMEVTIPLDHASFPGHFPGNPILPGVLLLERVMALAQSELGNPLENISLGSFTLLNVKFLAAVFPGDALSLKLVDSLTQSSCTEKIFTVHISQAGIADPVLACTGKLRLNDAR